MEEQPLKEFTIPRLKRSANTPYLERLPTDRREYGHINAALSESRQDLTQDLQSTWQFGEVKLVHNEDLESSFSMKRSEMRQGGRQARELEEQFCFLVLPDRAILGVYRNGMRTGKSEYTAIGNPLFGVYLYKHIDVALECVRNKHTRGENVMIFKTLLGRIKPVHPLGDEKKNCILDPTPNFDCHVSKSPPLPTDPPEQQTIGSLVYFYDYDEYSKPMKRPRQCLPYAVVTARFKGCKYSKL